MGISHVISWTNGVDLNQTKIRPNYGDRDWKRKKKSDLKQVTRHIQKNQFQICIISFSFFFGVSAVCTYWMFFWKIVGVFCCNLVIPIFVFLCKSCLPHVCFDPSIGWNESADFGKTCCLDNYTILVHTKKFLITICINC